MLVDREQRVAHGRDDDGPAIVRLGRLGDGLRVGGETERVPDAVGLSQRLAEVGGDGQQGIR
jgi:hypothetical protein